MNLKDRLDSISSIDKVCIKENTNKEPDILDIFEDNKNVRKIISLAINNGKNIILLSNTSCDKTLLIKYISSFVPEDRQKTEITSASEINSKQNCDIFLFEKPSIYEIVKILEYILYGYKSFIFTVDMNSFEDVLDKLSTVILVNFKNLTEKNVNTLIANSNAVFVYFSKNEDGLFTITNIGEIISENNIVNIVPIDIKESEPEQKLENEINTVIKSKLEEETAAYEKKDAIITEPILLPVEETTEELNHNEVEISIDLMPNEDVQTIIIDSNPNKAENNIDKPEDTIEPQKINKYKLLKEKVKNRRSSQK